MDNDAVKKAVYKPVTKVIAVDTKITSSSGLVTKTQHDSEEQGP